MGSSVGVRPSTIRLEDSSCRAEVEVWLRMQSSVPLRDHGCDAFCVQKADSGAAQTPVARSEGRQSLRQPLNQDWNLEGPMNWADVGRMRKEVCESDWTCVTDRVLENEKGREIDV